MRKRSLASVRRARDVFVGFAAPESASAVKLANLADVIRGYEEVKLRNVQHFREEVRRLGF